MCELISPAKVAIVDANDPSLDSTVWTYNALLFVKTGGPVKQLFARVLVFIDINTRRSTGKSREEIHQQDPNLVITFMVNDHDRRFEHTRL